MVVFSFYGMIIHVHFLGIFPFVRNCYELGVFGDTLLLYVRSQTTIIVAMICHQCPACLDRLAGGSDDVTASRC
jgi:hypothetical protein